MQQLSGLDALFLRLERGNTYMHVGPLMIYAPPKGGKGAPSFKTVQELLEKRLGNRDVLRRKLVEVPWQLDNPYWVEEHNFKVKNHIQRTRLRKPGGMRQLCNEVARIHSQLLDRAHPLWIAHIIYGLDDIAGLPRGSFAIYLKTHHAAMDGTTGAATIQGIHDPLPGAKGGTTMAHSESEGDPSSFDLLSRALVNNIRQPFRLAGVAGQAVQSIQRIVKGTREDRLSGLGEKARTRFNGLIGPDRVVGLTQLKLAEMKEVSRRVPGATINDVGLTIVSGAMRRYLDAKGELPGKSLVAAVPVNIRAHQPGKVGGNVISGMTVSLCSDVDDLLERLECVHQQSLAAKAWHEEMGPQLLTNLSDSLAPYLVSLISKPLLATGLLGRTPPIANTIVTNVPGPQQPLYFGGSKMVMISGVGPCADGFGLFHTISSYCDVVAVGFQACPRMLPDPEFYTRCIEETWDELKAAAMS